MNKHKFDAAGWTMLVFGLLVGSFGLLGLILPALLPKLLFFPAAPVGYSELFIRASSQASLAVGAYYILAAWHGVRKFYTWSVWVRFVNAISFSLMVLGKSAPVGWLMVAALELIGALTTWFALRREV